MWTVAVLALRAAIELEGARTSLGLQLASGTETYLDQAILGDETILWAYKTLYGDDDGDGDGDGGAQPITWARHYGRWSAVVADPAGRVQTQRVVAWCAAAGIALGIPVGGAAYALTNGCGSFSL